MLAKFKEVLLALYYILIFVLSVMLFNLRNYFLFVDIVEVHHDKM